MPWLIMVINLPFLIIGFAIKYLFFAKTGLVKEYHKGFCRALKKLDKVKRQKRTIKDSWACIKTELLMIGYTVDYVFQKLR
jgi:predicted small secreted protein